MRTEGQNRNTIYLLGDSYAPNNSPINKALAIGLKELKDKGEIKVELKGQIKGQINTLSDGFILSRNKPIQIKRPSQIHFVHL